MIYAQIKNNKVCNCIVLDDTNLLSLFSVGYDYLIRIDTVTPMPNIGWSYDGLNFSSIPYLTRLYIKGKIVDAMTFGKGVVADFAARNVIAGLTLDQVKYVMDKTSDIKTALEAGSLYVALDLISNIEPDPLLPRDVIVYYENQIKHYLGLL